VSSDQEKLDQLLAKVEEINQKLNRLSDELHTVSASVKSLAVGQITQSNPKPASPTPPPATPRPTTPPAETNKTRSLDDISMSFPEELEARLDFTEKGDYIIIKPKADRLGFLFGDAEVAVFALAYVFAAHASYGGGDFGKVVAA